MRTLHPHARAAGRAGLALAASLLAMCCEPPNGDGDDIPAHCLDDMIISVIEDNGGEDAATRRGAITLQERHYASGDPTTTVVLAKFGDFRLSTSSSQGGTALGGNCIGLSGQPVRSERHCEYTETSCEENADCEADVDCVEYDRLAVGGVSIDGLAGGSVALDQQGVGAFVKAGLTELFGTSPVDIHVTASGDAHAFIGEDASLLGITPPQFVELTAPDLSGAGALGRDNLFIEWTPGEDPDALVYITVVVEHISNVSADTRRNVKVTCAAYDDGCQTLWDTSIDWMTRPEPGWRLGDSVIMLISRRVQMAPDLSQLVADTELKAGLSAEVYGEMMP